MVWTKVGSTTLGGTADSITVSATFTLFYQQIFHRFTSGNSSGAGTFNGDTGSNYSERHSNDGGADQTNVSQNYIQLYHYHTGYTSFVYTHGVNPALNEKWLLGFMISPNAAGATNTPNRTDFCAKWANTSNAISSSTISNLHAGDYNANTDLTIIGTD